MKKFKGVDSYIAKSDREARPKLGCKVKVT